MANHEDWAEGCRRQVGEVSTMLAALKQRVETESLSFYRRLDNADHARCVLGKRIETLEGLMARIDGGLRMVKLISGAILALLTIGISAAALLVERSPYL